MKIKLYIKVFVLNCLLLFSSVFFTLILSEILYRLYFFNGHLTFQQFEENSQNKSTNEDVPSVYFFGGSFPSGYPLGKEFSYPSIIRSKIKNTKFQVINLSTPRTQIDEHILSINKTNFKQNDIVVWSLTSEQIFNKNKSSKIKPEITKTEIKPKEKRTEINPEIKITEVKPEEKRTLQNYLNLILSFHPSFYLFYDSYFNCHMSLISSIKEVLSSVSILYNFLKIKFNDNKFIQKSRNINSNSPPKKVAIAEENLKYYLNDKKCNNEDYFFSEIKSVSNYIENLKGKLFIVLIPLEYEVNHIDIFDNKNQNNNKFSKLKPNFCINQLSQLHGISLIDPTKIFNEKYSKDKNLYLKIDAHFSFIGSTLMANSILEDLRFRSYIEGKL